MSLKRRNWQQAGTHRYLLQRQGRVDRRTLIGKDQTAPATCREGEATLYTEIKPHEKKLCWEYVVCLHLN